MPFANNYGYSNAKGMVQRPPDESLGGAGVSGWARPRMASSTRRPLDRSIPAESVSLFTAIDDCRRTSHGLPQPVVARNSGLIDAWHAWSQRLERPADQGLTARLVATPRRSFEHNLATLLDCVRPDPLWQRTHPQGRANVAVDEATLVLQTAALMFWSRQRILIETNDVLEQLLVHSDVGDDLPSSLFHPPVPAVFIRLRKVFRDAVPLPPLHGLVFPVQLQGVYVFHSTRELNRVVSMVPVFEAPTLGIFCANTIEIVINDEARCLNAEIHAACSGCGGQGAHFSAIAQIVAKVFFYMEQAHAVHVEDHSHSIAVEQVRRRGAKKAARLGRHIQVLYDRIILGPHAIPSYPHGERSPHLRRGHFRLQPYGLQSSLRKVIFIAPTWIHADRLMTPTMNS